MVRNASCDANFPFCKVWLAVRHPHAALCGVLIKYLVFLYGLKVGRVCFALTLPITLGWFWNIVKQRFSVLMTSLVKWQDQTFVTLSR